MKHKTLRLTPYQLLVVAIFIQYTLAYIVPITNDEAYYWDWSNKFATKLF